MSKFESALCIGLILGSAIGTLTYMVIVLSIYYGNGVDLTKEGIGLVTWIIWVTIWCNIIYKYKKVNKKL